MTATRAFGDTGQATRLAPGHATRAGIQMDNILVATDAEYLGHDLLIEVERYRDWLQDTLLPSLESAIEAKKASKVNGNGTAKRQPKVETVDYADLTKKELAVLFEQHTGTPAPSKWKKAELVAKVEAAAA